MSFKPQARYAALSGYGALSDSLGLDWAPLMRSVGLDPAGLAAQDRWIPAAAVARLLEISASASGREDFGLSLVEFRRLANLGPLALAIREEPDVRSVLEMLIRYEHTYNQAISIRLSEANGLATIRMDLELGRGGHPPGHRTGGRHAPPHPPPTARYEVAAALRVLLSLRPRTSVPTSGSSGTRCSSSASLPGSSSAPAIWPRRTR